MTFPMSVGATTVLNPERPTPDGVAALLKKYPITVFWAVPTFYGAFISSPNAPQKSEVKMRRCLSAGEALPEEIARKWHERYGVEISDGLGTTEMLHIFLTNRPGATKYGTTGKPVPGYEIKLRRRGRPAGRRRARSARCTCRGPTSAIMYWNNREKSRSTFQGEWTRSGDKYIEDEDGYLRLLRPRRRHAEGVGAFTSRRSRSRRRCASHPDVLEAAVVGWNDEQKLVKPKAFVVLKSPDKASEALARRACRSTSRRSSRRSNIRAGSNFGSELPKTATGKIQRFKLRAEAP